jgi:hypothetical protein
VKGKLSIVGDLCIVEVGNWLDEERVESFFCGEEICESQLDVLETV